MKLINKLKFILLTLFAIIAVSCLDDSVTDFGNGPIVVQFPSKELSQNFLQDGSDKVYDFEIPLEYFGQDNTSFGNDVTVKIGLNTSKTTAIEGTEFSLPSETSFTIPAGTNTAMITLKVNSANLDALNPKVVALEILDSEGVSISESKNLILVTLQAICSSDLAGDWEYTSNGQGVTIKETDTGKYTISADNYFSGAYPFYITDVCGNLTITGGFLTRFGFSVSGEGTIIDSNTIELKYTVSPRFTDRIMTLQKK